VRGPTVFYCEARDCRLSSALLSSVRQDLKPSQMPPAQLQLLPLHAAGYPPSAVEAVDSKLTNPSRRTPPLSLRTAFTYDDSNRLIGGANRFLLLAEFEHIRILRHHLVDFRRPGPLTWSTTFRNVPPPLIRMLFTHRRSIAGQGGCFQRRLLDYQFVCLSTR